MSKTRFPLVLGGILLLSYAVFHAAGLVLAAVALGAVYVASGRLSPRTRHWRCGGTGEKHGWVFTWAHRKCGGCQSGRVVRWGAGRFGSSAVKAEAAQQRRSRDAARRLRAWR